MEKKLQKKKIMWNCQNLNAAMYINMNICISANIQTLKRQLFLYFYEWNLNQFTLRADQIITIPKRKKKIKGNPDAPSIYDQKYWIKLKNFQSSEINTLTYLERLKVVNQARALLEALLLSSLCSTILCIVLCD